jgi:stalled ribosome alternative rescue factor ArfA
VEGNDATGKKQKGKGQYERALVQGEVYYGADHLYFLFFPVLESAEDC